MVDDALIATARQDKISKLKKLRNLKRLKEQRTSSRPRYNYVEPEGEEEKIQFEATGDVVRAPKGTAQVYSAIENDASFDAPTGMFEEAAAVFEAQAGYLGYLAYATGGLADTQASDFISSRMAGLASAQKSQPQYVKDMGAAMAAQKGFFGKTLAAAAHPAALGRSFVTNAPNSVLPLITGFGGLKAGAVAGAATSPITGPAGPLAGGTLGFALGTGAGTAMVEFGAEMDQIASEMGYNTGNAEDLLEFFQNKEVMEEAKTRAAQKGFTTASVDAVFSMFGGKFIAMAKNAGRVKKTALAAADVGTQSVGEGVAEAAGQKVARGEVDIDEVILEGMTSVAGGGATTFMGSTIGAKKEKPAVPTKNLEAEFNQEMIDFFEDNDPVLNVPEAAEVIESLKEAYKAGEIIPTTELGGDVLKFAETLNSQTQEREQEVRLLEGKEFLPVPRGKPETLSEFLKSKGGVQNQRGELDTVKEDTTGLVVDDVTDAAQADIFGQLNIAAQEGKGLTLDQAREAAVEAGYLTDRGGENVSQSTTDDLVQALREEADGNPFYKPEDIDLVQRQKEARKFNEDLDEYIGKELSGVKQYVTFTTAFKEGARLAKKDVKASQESIIKLLDESKMRPEDKAKFIKSIKNIQTPAQAKKQMPKIQTRVESLLKADAVRSLRSNITKSLKKTKAKKQSGRIKGKFTPEIQSQLNELRRIDGLTKEQANEELRQVFTLEDIPTPEQRTKIAFLMAKAEASEASVESLSDLAINIRAIIQGGKAENIYLKSVKDSEVKRDAKELIGLIGDMPIKENYSWVDDFTENVKKGSVNFFNNWAGTLETKLLSAFDSSDNRAVERFVNTTASLFRESRAFDTGKREAILDVEQRILDESGISRKDLQRRMYKDTSTFIDLGNMVHSDGVTRRVKMTRAQARKRYMEFQDESLRDTLMDSETGNRYTEEIEAAIEASLTQTDIAIADAQLDFYNDYYDRVNVVYRKLYGVDLPRVEFYSPIRRAAFDKEASEFLQGIAMQGSVAPGSTKARVSSKSEILSAGDLEVLMSHIYEMEYFIAYAEKVNHMRRVFGNSEVQRLLKDKMGDEFARSVNKDIDYFSKKGGQSSFLGEKGLKALVRNFGFAQLAAKPQIGLKQLTSFPAMVSGVKVADFSAGLVEFAANPIKSLKILNESDFFRDRGIAIDKDFKAMTEDKHFLNIMGKNPSVLKFLMLPIRFGDKGAIAIGGYAHYHAKRKAGVSHKRALESFERLANKTQQSSDIDQLSQLQQRTDVISQALTQFMSSPNALARAEYRAIINFKKGRISKAEFAKQLFVYHILIPNLFTLMANGMEWDTEDAIKASILGAATGIFLISDILESVVGQAVSGDFFETKIRHPVEFVDDMLKFIGNISDGDIDLEDFWEGGKELNAGLKSVSAATGAPLATFHNQVTGARDVIEGDVVDGVYKVLGYSPWVVDNKINKKPEGGAGF